MKCIYVDRRTFFSFIVPHFHSLIQSLAQSLAVARLLFFGTISVGFNGEFQNGMQTHRNHRRFTTNKRNYKTIFYWKKSKEVRRWHRRGRINVAEWMRDGWRMKRAALHLTNQVTWTAATVNALPILRFDLCMHRMKWEQKQMYRTNDQEFHNKCEKKCESGRFRCKTKIKVNILHRFWHTVCTYRVILSSPLE